MKVPLETLMKRKKAEVREKDAFDEKEVCLVLGLFQNTDYQALDSRKIKVKVLFCLLFFATSV